MVGQGARGNTTYILRALLAAGVQHTLVGVFTDSALVRAAFAAGKGGTFTAELNSRESNEFSEPLSVPGARVLQLSQEGCFVASMEHGGVVAGQTVKLGPSCLLQLGGIQLLAISHRQQILSTDYFSALFGVEPSNAACIVVKSRGHFRAGFQHLWVLQR